MIVDRDEVLSLEDLFCRWPGADERILFGLVEQENKLSVYHIVRTLLDKKTQKKEIELELSFFSHVTYFDDVHDVNFLQEYFFLEFDVFALELERPELWDKVVLNRQIPIGQNQEQALEDETALLEQRIRDLERQLEEAKAAATNSQTGAATAARQERALDRWKEAFKAMPSAAMEIAREDPPKVRIAADLNKLLRRYGQVSDSQCEFFRSCLPAEYKHDVGAPKQG